MQQTVIERLSNVQLFIDIANLELGKKTSITRAARNLNSGGGQGPAPKPEKILKIRTSEKRFPVIWASYESAVLVTLEELVTLRPSSGVGIFICGKKWGLSSPQLHGPCLWPINMSSVAEIYILSGEVYFCACLFKIVGFLICTACRNEIQIN